MLLARRATLALLAATALVTPALAAEPVTVAVTAIVEHPALDAARDGIKDALKARRLRGWQEPAFRPTRAPRAIPATAAQIARKWWATRPTVIVPISTPSAQAVVARDQDIPVVFTAVTDPVGAKLVDDLEHPGRQRHRHVRPVADRQASRPDQGDHAGGEAAGRDLQSGRGQLGDADRAAQEGGAGARPRASIEAPAPKSADVLPAAQSLVGPGRCDLRADRQHGGVGARGHGEGRRARTSCRSIAGDTDSVPRGAIAAIGFNYYRCRPADGQDRRCAC